MEPKIESIKNEPIDYIDVTYQEYSSEDIKSEISVTEIDESIYGIAEQLATTEQLNACYRTNNDDEHEDGIIMDDIVKEEPEFYDARMACVLSLLGTNETAGPTETQQHMLSNDETVPSEQRIFECYICRCQSENIGLLNWHIKERHSERNESKSKQSSTEKRVKSKSNSIIKSQCFDCSYCGRKFYNHESVKIHERIHINEKPFQCEICLKTYNNKTSFAVHKTIHTGENKFHCNQCDKKFRLKIQLNRHIRSHTNVSKNPNETLEKIKLKILEEEIVYKSFECYLCSFQGSKNQLLMHMRVNHTRDKMFECNICFKKFLLEHSVTTHKKIHSKSNSFKCHICGRSFNRKDGLKIHLQMHTGEHPFECQYCPKKFTKKYTLNTHVRTHTGFKPFQCEYCKKKFIKKSDLVRHTRTHTGERPFKCDMCKMNFTRNHTLTDHKQNIHGVF